MEVIMNAMTSMFVCEGGRIWAQLANGQRRSLSQQELEGLIAKSAPLESPDGLRQQCDLGLRRRVPKSLVDGWGY